MIIKIQSESNYHLCHEPVATINLNQFLLYMGTFPVTTLEIHWLQLQYTLVATRQKNTSVATTKKDSVAIRRESQVIAAFDIFKCKLQLRLLVCYNSKDTLIATAMIH
jgi:hypothetical protein